MGTTNGHGTVERNWSLPLDVYERDNTLFIRAAVPGIKPEDLNVSIEENILTITGEMNEEITEQDKVYRREYRYGKFSRSLTLPENIDTNGIEANFDNGFVKISLPKVEPVKPQALKIPVKFLGDAPIQEGKTDPKEA
jgi:HSP20 family protein